MDEWFRGTNWSSADEEEFFIRLNRARSDNRAQYLRLKGSALCESLDDQAQSAGVKLLEMVISEYPDDLHQIAGSHSRLARYFEEKGNPKAAFRHYQQSIEASGNDAFRSKLRLAELIVRNELDDEFAYAASLLNEAQADDFITNDFAVRISVARARLASMVGEDDSARRYAREALEMISDNDPAFPNHPQVGRALIDDETFDELLRLAKHASA